MKIEVEVDDGLVTWETWQDEEQGCAGWRATHSDGRIEYLYLAPSGHIDPGGGDRHADAFLYHGATGEPWNDSPHHYYDVFVEDDRT